MTEAEYNNLDPGIRNVVRFLRAWEFNTTDSGDGVSKVGTELEAEMIHRPHVVMTTDRATLLNEADRLVAVLGTQGIQVQAQHMSAGIHIQASYDPIDGICTLVLFGVNDELLTEASARVTAH